MSDNPTVQQRAANLLQARLSWPQAEGCAKDLAAAGLLADPTPTLTPEQADVIEAVDDIRWLDIYPEVKRLIAAVDRLAATKEST